MGTSTVHRSPATLRWRIVNNLYNDPSVSVDRLLAEVFNAAESYPSGLADAAVLRRVEAVLDASRTAIRRGETEDALAAARQAVQAAQHASVQAGLASFYGDLADRAIHATLVGASRAPNTMDTPLSALGAFLSNLVASAIDHVVSRDLTAHIGGPRIRTASEGLALRRALVERARQIAASEQFSATVGEAASSPRQHWARLVTEVWKVGATPPSEGKGPRRG